MKTVTINMEAQLEDDENSDELLERIITALAEHGINASLDLVETHP